MKAFLLLVQKHRRRLDFIILPSYRSWCVLRSGAVRITMTNDRGLVFAWINSKHRNVRMYTYLHMSYDASTYLTNLLRMKNTSVLLAFIFYVHFLPPFSDTYVSCLSHVCHGRSWRIGAPHDDSGMQLSRNLTVVTDARFNPNGNCQICNCFSHKSDNPTCFFIIFDS